MQKCRKCLCKSCAKNCGCLKCKETDGAVAACASHNKFEQLSLFPPEPKPVKKKLPRNLNFNYYGIGKDRLDELTEMCQSGKYDTVARFAAYTANPEITEYILLSVMEDVSYDSFSIPKYEERLGGIYICRTDFYGYKRLFYHIFDEEIKKNGEML